MSADRSGPHRPGASTVATSSPRLPEAPPCPFCEGRQTELFNAFGAHASVSSYWCLDCRSPFELMKWSGGSSGARPEGTR